MRKACTSIASASQEAKFLVACSRSPLAGFLKTNVLQAHGICNVCILVFLDALCWHMLSDTCSDTSNEFCDHPCDNYIDNICAWLSLNACKLQHALWTPSPVLSFVQALSWIALYHQIVMSLSMQSYHWQQHFCNHSWRCKWNNCALHIIFDQGCSHHLEAGKRLDCQLSLYRQKRDRHQLGGCRTSGSWQQHWVRPCNSYNHLEVVA